MESCLEVGRTRRTLTPCRAGWSDEAELIVVPPTIALALARPLPSANELAIDGLTEVEWQALDDAVAVDGRAFNCGADHDRGGSHHAPASDR